MHRCAKYYPDPSNKENAVSFTSSRWYIIFDCKEDKKKGILMLRGVQIDLEYTVNLNFIIRRMMGKSDEYLEM